MPIFLGLVKHLLFMAGVLLICYGFWLAWHPLGWILLGAVVVYSALLFDKSSETTEKKGNG